MSAKHDVNRKEIYQNQFKILNSIVDFVYESKMTFEEKIVAINNFTTKILEKMNSFVIKEENEEVSL